MTDESIAEVLNKIVEIVVVPTDSVLVFQCDRNLSMQQAAQMKEIWHGIAPEIRAVFVSGVAALTAVVDRQCA